MRICRAANLQGGVVPFRPGRSAQESRSRLRAHAGEVLSKDETMPPTQNQKTPENINVFRGLLWLRGPATTETDILC